MWMNRYRRIRHITALFLVLFLFSQLALFSIELQQKAKAVEPEETPPNPDKTITATWDFDDESYYELYNLTMQNSAVNLTLGKFWWNQTTAGNFSTGTFVNTTVEPLGGVTLRQEWNFTNLVNNGSFSSGGGWAFVPGNNITSFHNPSDETADMRYTYIAGASITYINILDGEDDGHASHLMFTVIYSNATDLEYTEVGLHSDMVTNYENRSFFYFDLGIIPSSAVISSVEFCANLSQNSSNMLHSVNIYGMELARGAHPTDQDIWDDCGNGSLYVDNQNLMGPGKEGWWEWSLAGPVVTDLQDDLSRGWFGIGIIEVGDDVQEARLNSSESSNPPQLKVSYTSFDPVTFNDTAYVNQTFSKPTVTPGVPEVVNLSFNFTVEQFFGEPANLTVKIDDISVWTQSITAVTPLTTVYVDVGGFMTEARDYNISLQLHMDVVGSTNVECNVRFDDVNITAMDIFLEGIFTSEEHTVGAGAIWDEISWDVNPHPETSYSIRTRSFDGLVWSDWSSEYSNKSGEQIMSPPGTRIQYTVNLSTTNYLNLPELYDVNISYMVYCWNGTLEMKNDYLAQELDDWGTFMAEDIQTNGQNITYWYSIDSGGNWTQVPYDGNLSSVNISTGKIRFRANFTTDNPIFTPTLYKWNLTYRAGERAILIGDVEPGWGYITTYFNFTVNYTDEEGDIAEFLRLNITSGTSNIGWHNMDPVDPNDNDVTDGKWYYLNMTGFERGDNYSFHFSAKDLKDIWSTSQTINDPDVINAPPKITTSDDQGADENQLYYVDYEADDLEDKDNLTWYLNTNASWLDIDQTTGNISGTPTNADKGFYWVNVTVDDGHGGLDWRNFTLTVGDEIPPIADAGPDGIVDEDQPYTFNGTNSSDNSGVLNYSWNFIDGSIKYGPTPTHVFTINGTWPVWLWVTDPAGNWDIDFINIIVRNIPPVADAGNDRIVNECDLVYFDASNSYDTASDNDTLIYTWDFDGDGYFNEGVGPYPNYTWIDNQIVTVGLKVLDNNQVFDIDTITVDVLNVVPTVDIEDNYIAEKGTEIVFIAYGKDPAAETTPVADILEYRWDWDNDGTADTTWSSIFVGRKSWGTVGIYTVRVEVRDNDGGFGYDTASVNITERKSPPEIDELGSRQIRYGESYRLDLAPYITDEDTPLSDLIVWTSDPDHISIDGVVIWLIYNDSWKGMTFPVDIFVSDGTFLDNETLVVNVTENYPPILKLPIPDVEFNEDGVYDRAFNLYNHFEDDDRNDVLTFYADFSETNLIITIDADGWVNFRSSLNWFGTVDVTLRASDPHGAFAEDTITVNINPVNDPPIVWKQIEYTTIEENDTWTIYFYDHFLDVDDYPLTFSCNNPEIQIDTINHTATWVPGNKKELKGVIFTASDGEHGVELNPIDLKVFQPEPFNWLLFILPFILGLLVFAAYREIRYRYAIEEVFLVDNAGVLLVHLSRGESKAIDAKLVSGMLTAVQEFVKDSFRGGDDLEDVTLDDGALGKLEYGDFKIVTERGEYTFLSAVISGYDNKRLRNRMRDVVEEFEKKYRSVLEDWDGDMAKFDGAEDIVGTLLKTNSKDKSLGDESIPEEETGEQEYDTDHDIEELPSGDFADVPSSYDETLDDKEIPPPPEPEEEPPPPEPEEELPPPEPEEKPLPPPPPD